MKKTVSFIGVSGLAVAALLTFLSGCSKSKPNTRTYTIQSPIFVSKASYLAAINGNPAQPIDSTGKIFVNGRYIFLNEPEKGIHIIDNIDPTHPQQIAYLAIPGNQDIAVKGNTLYADMYTDLLAIDISNPKQVKVTGKVPNLFTNRTYYKGLMTSTPDQIVVGWTTKDTTVIIPPGARPGATPCCLVYDYYPGSYNVSAASSSGSSASSGTGTAGSMAAMVVLNNTLYAIAESHSIGIVNVTNAATPSFIRTLFDGNDLETIFPFGNQLFLGSIEGVFMYDISKPEQPVRVGQFSHGTACDPVVADGTYAYVTLHAGTTCGGASNELDIMNIQDPSQAKVIKSYPMTKPQGLCKDGNLLFVCDGTTGVKVFDAKDPANSLPLLATTGEGQAYDVIAASQHMLVVADKGIYQYDYSNPASLRSLSFLPINH